MSTWVTQLGGLASPDLGVTHQLISRSREDCFDVGVGKLRGLLFDAIIGCQVFGQVCRIVVVGKRDGKASCSKLGKLARIRDPSAEEHDIVD